MRPVLIVFASPLLDLVAGIIKTFKYRLMKTFFPKPAVETFNERIVGRFLLDARSPALRLSSGPSRFPLQRRGSAWLSPLLAPACQVFFSPHGLKTFSAAQAEQFIDAIPNKLLTSDFKGSVHGPST
jgi:hypothetical protein